MATKEKPAPQGADAVIPDPVRVYNRSNRTFIHKHEGVEYRAAPNAMVTVPAPVAELWLARGDEVIEAAEAQKQIGGSQAELGAARVRIAELEEQLAANPKTPAAAQKRIKDLEQEVADLEKLMESHDADVAALKKELEAAKAAASPV